MIVVLLRKNKRWTSKDEKEDMELTLEGARIPHGFDITMSKQRAGSRIVLGRFEGQP